jgi:peptidoglycan/LPS O-acetylase OafA/YrhL
LDGIRAVAISAVLADHLRLQSVHAGALGVDVFFVLSGYLITGLLVAEHRKTGRIDLPAFYLRRATRLYPALIAFLAAGAVIDLFDLQVAGSTVVWATLIAGTYITDIMTYTDNVTWLLYAHTWSLSIEEHFYLIWPAGLLVARRRRLDVRALAFGGALVFLVVGFLAAAPPRNGIAYDYFQPQAHAFSLLAGCSLALVAAPRVARHLALPCLLAIAVLVVVGPPLGLNYLRSTAMFMSRISS